MDNVDQEFNNYWETNSFLQNEDFEYDRFFLVFFIFVSLFLYPHFPGNTWDSDIRFFL